jgi:hypothetical protein
MWQKKSEHDQNGEYIKSLKNKSMKCDAKKEEEKQKQSLKICTKQGVNLMIRWGNGGPEGLDWVTQHCSLR